MGYNRLPTLLFAPCLMGNRHGENHAVGIVDFKRLLASLHLMVPLLALPVIVQMVPLLYDCLEILLGTRGIFHAGEGFALDVAY